MKSRLERIIDSYGRPPDPGPFFVLIDPPDLGCSVHGVFCEEGDFFDPLSQLRNHFTRYGVRPPPPRGAGSWCATCSIRKKSELCDICPRRPDFFDPLSAVVVRRPRKSIFARLMARKTRRIRAKEKTK